MKTYRFGFNGQFLLSQDKVLNTQLLGRRPKRAGETVISSQLSEKNKTLLKDTKSILTIKSAITNGKTLISVITNKENIVKGASSLYNTIKSGIESKEIILDNANKENK